MNEDAIKTERLILRPWQENDLEPFARLNSDPRVMEFFPGLLSKEESDQFAQRINNTMKEQGWGLWAVSIPNVSDFIGYVGLTHVNFAASFTPAVEVGWRIAYDFWNKGYATEGAQAALRYGFEKLHLDEIISFTFVNNKRSRRVMEKIGMQHDPNDDFEHPKLPVGHPLSNHVLYRIKTGYFTQIWESPPENFQPRVEVAACYLEIDGRILLMERSIHSAEGRTWGVPAGKVEVGESPHQAAIRELFEETGIKVAFSQVKEMGTLYVQKPRGAFTYHMFQIDLLKIPQVILSQEHTKYLWANAEDLKTLQFVGGGKEALDLYRRMKFH